MSEIRVRKVSPDRSRVVMEAVGKEYIFRKSNNGKVEVVSTPGDGVPPALYNKMYRQAVAILLPRRRIVLFDEAP